MKKLSFQDVKGQDNAIGFLKNSIAGNKISHAYIFAGPSGIGKKLAAVNFAKALNCLGPADGGPCDASTGSASHPELVDGCDACAQCKKIEAFNHPDVLIFSPAKEESSLGIEKVRALTKDIGLKPYEGRKKVYILDNADSMTHEAQNALLKTLEEPPSDSVMILIAENANTLFPTIQSRAKKVKFFPLAAEEVKKILMEKYKLDKDNAEVLSRISSGELGKAIKYNAEGFFEKRKRIIDALRGGALLDSDLDGFSKPDLRLALDVMLTWYRDILIAKAGVDNRSVLVNADKADIIYGEAKLASFEWLNNIINQVILTGSFLDQNINPKLAMGVLGMNLTKGL